MNPNISDDGVPYCSRDECRDYDGKRCGRMGFQPHRICEPGVIAMADWIEIVSTTDEDRTLYCLAHGHKTSVSERICSLVFQASEGEMK